jgi:hypothetical protein
MYGPTDKQEWRTARGLAARLEPILAAVAWTDGVIAAVCCEIGAAVIDGLGAYGAAHCGRAPNHQRYGEDDDVRR